MSRTTVTDVAKLAKVSVTTASRVLNPNARQGIAISQATTERVQEAAKSLNYTPDRRARMLRQRTSALVGFLVPSMEGHSGPTLLNTISQLLSEQEKELVVGTYGTNLDRARHHIEMFRSYRTTGVIVHSRIGVIPDEVIQALREGRTECGPFICIAGREQRPGVTYVAQDHDAGVKSLLHTLEEDKVRHVLFVVQSDPVSSALGELLEAVLPAHPNLGAEILRFSSATHREFGSHALDRIRRERMQEGLVVVTENDMDAFAILSAAQEAGLSVPKDFALVGRGNLPIAEQTRPMLTTIDLMGYIPAIAEKTLQLIADAEQGKELPAKRFLMGDEALVVRESYIPKNMNSRRVNI